MKKILVVEDDNLNLELIKDMLSYSSYDVIGARSGFEGIEIAKREKFDLILMDIQMPEIDGITAMNSIRKIPGYKKIPIIAVTAYSMFGDRDKFLSYGFNNYISKPIKVLELLEKIKEYL